MIDVTTKIEGEFEAIVTNPELQGWYNVYFPKGIKVTAKFNQMRNFPTGGYHAQYTIKCHSTRATQVCSLLHITPIGFDLTESDIINQTTF